MWSAAAPSRWTRDDGSPAIFVARNGTLIGEIALIIEDHASRHRHRARAVLGHALSRELMRRVLEEFPEAAVAMKDILIEELGRLTDGLEGVRQSLLAIDGGKE